MKLFRIFAAAMMLASGLLALAACQAIASPLEDFSWILTQYGEPGNTKATLPDTQITALFDNKTKQVSGSSGCNRYNGTYEVDRLTLKITGPLAMTEMYCGDDKNAQETAFLKALQNADSFEMEQGKLIIHSGENRLYFRNEGPTVKPPAKWGE